MITSLKRIVIFLGVITLLAIVCTGCRHTARGFGKDMENAGEKIQQKTR